MPQLIQNLQITFIFGALDTGDHGRCPRCCGFYTAMEGLCIVAIGLLVTMIIILSSILAGEVYNVGWSLGGL